MIRALLETAINYWPVGVLGHVYSRVSPYDHTLKGQKPNEDEIQIRLGLGALMGHLGPKGGTQGGAQGSPPKGLYKQKGAPKNPNPCYCSCARTVPVNSSAPSLFLLLVQRP